MNQNETEEILKATLRFSLMGTPVTEMDLADSEEGAVAWKAGHLGGLHQTARVLRELGNDQ